MKDDDNNNNNNNTCMYMMSRDEVAQALSEFMVKKVGLEGTWETFRLEITTDDGRIFRSLWFSDLNPEHAGTGLGLRSAVVSLHRQAKKCIDCGERDRRLLRFDPHRGARGTVVCVGCDQNFHCSEPLATHEAPRADLK